MHYSKNLWFSGFDCGVFPVEKKPIFTIIQVVCREVVVENCRLVVTYEFLLAGFSAFIMIVPVPFT